MKKIPISILCGIVSVLVTIVLYFTILENIFSQLICFVTLVGTVLAETVATLLAYYSNGEPRKVGATIVASLMVPISIVLSFIYIVSFPLGYGSYLGYYFIAFAVLLLISAIIWKFSDNKEGENEEIQSAKSNMLNLRKMVKSVMLESGAEKYSKALSDIEEKLHFSNDAVITDLDENIYNMLVVLQNNINDEGFDAQKHIENLAKEVDRRTIMSKRTV